MTANEAIAQLRCNTYGDFVNEDDLEAFTVAISALEKQIPKKPQSFDSVPRNRCPICHDAVRVYGGSMKLPYCCWCGQALDWSDNDET